MKKIGKNTRVEQSADASKDAKPSSPPQSIDQSYAYSEAEKKQKLADLALPLHINLPKISSESALLKVKYLGQLIGEGKVLAGQKQGLITYDPTPLAELIPEKHWEIEIFKDGKKTATLSLIENISIITAESAMSSMHLADTFGDEAGPNARARGYRIGCLRVNGTNANQRVDSEIELSTDFGGVPSSIRYRRQRLHITISDSDGSAIHDQFWELGSDPSPSLHLNLSDITGSTPGTYEISGNIIIFYDPVVEDCTADPGEPGYWGWWPVNNMNLYFEVEPPFVIPRLETVEPYEIPDIIPSGGNLRLSTTENRVTVDERFSLTWDPIEDVDHCYLTIRTHAEIIPDPGVTLLVEEHDPAEPGVWSGTVNSLIEDWIEEYASRSMDDLTMEYFGHRTLYLQVRGWTGEPMTRQYRCIRASNQVILHVTDPEAESWLPAPILGSERREDSAILFWSHEPTGEGTFTIERAYVIRDSDELRWSIYASGISADQNMLVVPKEDLGIGDFPIQYILFRMHFVRPGAVGPSHMSPPSNITRVSPFLVEPILMQIIPLGNLSWSDCWAYYLHWMPNVNEYQWYEEQVSSDRRFRENVSTGRSAHDRMADGEWVEYADHFSDWTELLEGSPKVYIRRRTFTFTAHSPWSNILMLEFAP